MATRQPGRAAFVRRRHPGHARPDNDQIIRVTHRLGPCFNLLSGAAAELGHIHVKRLRREFQPFHSGQVGEDRLSQVPCVVMPNFSAMTSVWIVSDPSGAIIWPPSSLSVFLSATSLISPRASRAAKARGT